MQVPVRENSRSSVTSKSRTRKESSDKAVLSIQDSETTTLWKPTLELWAYTAIKSPMMFYLRPTITQLDEQSTTIRVKLKRRNKNPFNSMYFGALSSGAETVPGITIVNASRRHNIPVSFWVKEFHGIYLDRADRNMVFNSQNNQDIHQAILDSSADGTAKHLTVTVNAYKENSLDIAAKFLIDISIKSGAPRPRMSRT